MIIARIFITLQGDKIPFFVLVLPQRNHRKSGQIFLGGATEPGAVFAESAVMAGAQENLLFLMIVETTAEMGALSRYCPRTVFVDKKDKIVFKNKAAVRHDLMHLHRAWLLGSTVAEKAKNRIQKEDAGTPSEP